MMAIETKWAITCAIILLAIVLSSVGRTKFRWLVSEENWRGGKLDPMRWFLFDKNGELRPGGLFAFHCAILAILWIL